VQVTRETKFSLSFHFITSTVRQRKYFAELVWIKKAPLMGFTDLFCGYFAVGLTALIHNTMYGGYHALVMSHFNIEHFCATIQDHMVTYCFVVAPVILLLSKNQVVDKYDLSSLRMITSAAAPLTQELIKTTSRRVKVAIKQGYGLSETSSTCYVQSWEDWEKYMGSVGKLLPNMEAKYMTCGDPESVELPIGEVDELYIRGPNVFMGCLVNPRVTAESILAIEGWFRTGDIGYQEKWSNFYISDRAKELIKYKGFQVAPAEFEGILLQNEAVDDVAVIGIDSQEYGTEVPRAYVVLSKKAKSDICETEEAAKIMQWVEKRLISTSQATTWWCPLSRRHPKERKWQTCTTRTEAGYERS
jgi:4-coumarate--CoA ligase